MTHFIFDCDDVLLDWESGFIDYVEQMTHTTIDRAGPKSWCLAEWIGCTPDGAKAWVESFNGSAAFGQLNARPGARELVWDLRNAGHTLSVLTACGERRDVQRARAQNLWDIFAYPPSVASDFISPFEGITMLPLGGSKFSYLFEFTRNRDPRNVAFIEDNFEHAQSGVVNGIKSYCLRRSHNRQQEADNPDTQVIWIDHLDAIRLDFIPANQPNVDYTARSES